MTHSLTKPLSGDNCEEAAHKHQVQVGSVGKLQEDLFRGKEIKYRVSMVNCIFFMREEGLEFPPRGSSMWQVDFRLFLARARSPHLPEIFLGTTFRGGANYQTAGTDSNNNSELVSCAHVSHYTT